MKFGPLFGMALLACFWCTTNAQGQPLPGEELRPRIGLVSEEVVREKFKSYGVDIRQLERRENAYIVHTQTPGLPATLEVDLQTGAVRQPGGPSLRITPLPSGLPLAVKPDSTRVPWTERTIRIEKIGPEGLRLPALPDTR